MGKAPKAVALLLVVALMLLLGPCDGRELKGSGAASVGEEKATGLPLIPQLPPGVIGPVVPLPPLVPGIPPARNADKSSP